MHEDPTRLMGPEDRGPGDGRPHGNMRLLVAGLVAVIVGLLIAVIVIASNDGIELDATRLHLRNVGEIAAQRAGARVDDGKLDHDGIDAD